MADSQLMKPSRMELWIDHLIERFGFFNIANCKQVIYELFSGEELNASILWINICDP